ncbi:MAG: hypothetical protein KDA60_14555 [Planctomycetales bacterium]|nr:hypothetical protein [Planctomycetales bacterium]
MNLQHVNVKVFVDGECAVGFDQVVEVFHRWVANQSLDEMLIDVADYKHVPDGPGIVLVGHEADYALDETDGRLGLKYNRKAALDGSNQDRLGQAFAQALKACARLEQELAGLKFSRQQFEVTINDRALAPHNAEGQEALAAELAAFLKTQYGQEAVETSVARDPRSLLGAQVRLASSITS